MALEHKFELVSVSFPCDCLLCGNFVITPRLKAYHCTGCDAIFHNSCVHILREGHVSDTEKVNLCDNLAKSTSTNIFQAEYVKCTEQKLESWNADQIETWVTCYGFYEIFETFDFQQQLLSGSIATIKFKSSHVRSVIKTALATLNGDIPCPEELNFCASATLTKLKFSSLVNVSSNTSPLHDMRMANFPLEVSCAICDLPLLGLHSQGLHCEKCGMITHKICHAQASKLIEGYPIPCVQNDPFKRQRKASKKSEILTLSRLNDSFKLNSEDGSKDDFKEQQSSDYSRLWLPYNEDMLMNNEWTDQRHLPQQMGHLTGSNFTNTEESSGKTTPQVPDFFTTCLDLMDAKITEASFDFSQLYRGQFYCDRDNLLELKKSHSLTNPTEETSFMDVAALLELFLRDMPPVLDAFSSSKTSPEPVKVYYRLPKRHQLILDALFKHLLLVWQLCTKRKSQLVQEYPQMVQTMESQDQLQALNSHIDQYNEPRIWLRYFARIIYKPPKQRISNVQTFSRQHLDFLVSMFMNKTSAQMTELQIVEFQPLLQIPLQQKTELLAAAEEDTTFSTVSTTLQQLSIEEDAIYDDLVRRVYFWDSLPDSEKTIFEMYLEDGSFLVRKASTTRQKTRYTITFRTSGEIKSRKIYEKAGFVDFVHPPRTDLGTRLISELVATDATATDFLHPMCKIDYMYRKLKLTPIPLLKEASYPPEMAVLESRLQEVYRKLYCCNDDLDYWTAEVDKIGKRCEESSIKLNGFEKYQNWMDNQMSLLVNLPQQEVVDTHKSAIVKMHVQNINQKLRWILKLTEETKEEAKEARNDRTLLEDRLSELKNQPEYCEMYIAELMRVLKIHYTRDQEELWQQLKDRHMIKCPKRSLWFVSKADQTYNMLLDKSPVGTYFVRPSNTERNSYVLVVMSNKGRMMVHIYAEEDENGVLKYGWKSKPRMFSSIQEQIEHSYEQMIPNNVNNQSLNLLLKQALYAP